MQLKHIINHYNDVIMSAVVSQITSISTVCSTVSSDADQRKHQSSASLAFVWRIHRWPVNSPHKRPVMWKIFPFDEIIMMVLFFALIHWYKFQQIYQHTYSHCRGHFHLQYPNLHILLNPDHFNNISTCVTAPCNGNLNLNYTRCVKPIYLHLISFSRGLFTNMDLL